MSVTQKDAVWASGHDESVEVNQRALIDKILARYSGEFTVFRELLQNSDDAHATAVEIRFETQAFLDKKDVSSLISQEHSSDTLPDLRTVVVHQWSFKNNGIQFRDEDWNRLKKIAEGNPTEENIGAFGVGFYSLFSVTEEPFVTSGDQWMGFYWKDKKDQLFARRGQLPSDGNPMPIWTTIEMTLREPAPIPVPFDFTRFLASSITFMTHLSEVVVYFDDKRLVRLAKSSGISKEIGIPNGLQNSSPLGIMSVKDIKSTPLHINAEVMRWVYSSGSEKPRRAPISKTLKSTGARSFFSSLFTSFSASPTQRSDAMLPAPREEVINPLSIDETSVSLSIFSADVVVRLDGKLSVELHRSTKKNPPNKLKYELIYTAKDEYDASKKDDEKQTFSTGSIFQGLRADLDGAGQTRIFIGHATGQTTGLGGHMAARFIPTVERESIDLMDRNVAVWNRELLYVGALLARAAYELELNDIKNLWNSAISPGSPANSVDEELQAGLRSRSLHTLKFFTFYPSTPSAEVSNILEANFFSCAKGSRFPVISTAGVRDASEVRLPDSTLSGFLKHLPVLPDEILTHSPAMISSLENRGMIKSVTFVDVLKELRARPLGEDEMIVCLTWWIDMSKEHTTWNFTHRAELLDAAVLTTGKSGSTNEKIIALGSIQTFINSRTISSIIPLDGPLPGHLLPVTISKNFSSSDITSTFPWTELTISKWLEHVCSTEVRIANVNEDLTTSPIWAERVLMTLARAWPTLSAPTKAEVFSHLGHLACIPTSSGMRIPNQSYFPQANIFNDLPVATFPSGAMPKGSLERVLQALGVRRHVELQIIFNRMIKTNEWTVADLAKYLVSVQSTLTEEEWDRLKMTAAFFKETDQNGGHEDQKPNRYQAHLLYEPVDVFRQLGLPVLDWGKQTKWRGSSDEAKFLFQLGLLRRPPITTVIHLCASADSAVRSRAFKYLLDNIGTHYKDYDPSDFSDIAFIPSARNQTTCLETPETVCSNPEWGILGFSVISQNLPTDALAKLKIKQHPPTTQIVALLKKSPPKDRTEAKSWFDILSGRIHDFSSQELQQLSRLPIVPIPPEQSGPFSLRWLPPIQCYFGGDAKNHFHSKLFVFVDFGTRANAFLSACGTKHEPSVEEVVLTLLDNPHKFYSLTEGSTQFLAELRNIAVNDRFISSGTLNKMKKSAILLGSRRQQSPKTEGQGNIQEIDDDEYDLQYDLRKPEEIVIADDTYAHQAFGESLFAAPQEDVLEAFYLRLGSKRLSSLVKEEYQRTSEFKHSAVAGDTRALILERLPLFLHEHTHARTRVPYSWLTSNVNFVVRTYGKLSVTKSLAFGSISRSQKQDASAVAHRTGQGPIELWIAGNSQVDMYEVATSLNRILFDSPKANDSLLLMTIFSTDLKALKRRGYNVDRILRQQKAESQATESGMGKPGNTVLVSKSSVTGSVSPSNLGHSKPNSENSNTNQLPPSTTNMLKQKEGSSLQPAHSPPNIPTTTRPIAKRPMNSSADVTPLSNIASNIDMAIRACRPESGNLLRNREEMRQVRESLDEGYCDISGRAEDLNRVGEMRNVKVYLSQEVPDQQAFISVKREPLARFIDILVLLTKVYDLPVTSLHVFYDVKGGLIAFNRSGSIFLNLRYYQEWHDTEVRKNNLNPAFISWYFTLAHEIAHNLVQPHNSEHEFYFSALCEKHIMKLGSLLSG